VEVRQKLSRLIERVRLFSGLTQVEISYLLKQSRPRRLEAGQVLICAGSPPSSLFVILSGAMQVTTERGDQQEVLATLHAGSTVGEMALIDNAPRSARVVAEGMVTALEFERSFLETAPQGLSLKIYQNLSRILAHRVRSSNKQMQSIAPWPKGPNELAAVLKDTGLRHLDLRGVDFYGSRLSGAQLSGADLRRADFQGADLRDARFTDARMREEDLSDADLEPLPREPKTDEGTAENWAKLQSVIAKKKQVYKRS